MISENIPYILKFNIILFLYFLLFLKIFSQQLRIPFKIIKEGKKYIKSNLFE